MLAPTQPHKANGTISSARLLKSQYIPWASDCFAKLKVSTCILPQSLLQFSGIPSRKRRKLSADVVAACGRKVRPQQVSCEGGGLGERLRLQGEAVCVSCHRSLSLLPPTTKSNTLNTTFTAINFTTDPKASGAVVCALCVLHRLPNNYAHVHDAGVSCIQMRRPSMRHLFSPMHKHGSSPKVPFQ